MVRDIAGEPQENRSLFIRSIVRRIIEIEIGIKDCDQICSVHWQSLEISTNFNSRSIRREWPEGAKSELHTLKIKSLLTITSVCFNELIA